MINSCIYFINHRPIFGDIENIWMNAPKWLLNAPIHQLASITKADTTARVIQASLASTATSISTSADHCHATTARALTVLTHTLALATQDSKVVLNTNLGKKLNCNFKFYSIFRRQL